MKVKFLWVLAGVFVSACMNDGGGSSVVSRPTQVEGNKVTKALIETCWKQAGIKGDLYKFMSPEEAVGVQPGGLFSESQHAAFQSCLKA
ncbi:MULTISPECIES: 50S ribosomal protein L20 [Rhodobacterales]|jgi:hypothetical protein|uniref:50S ribosomal protein L20 n=1 Tax=Rhodobacterales TaxID=204455 RepID=UPI00237FAFD7|nr:50S ribosomal protein L20 [Phaeobacter gallaeciensis]MDE4140118.1 50S ribosomal protein L20 [Phaeobacter gallaeciensis]MDE4148272.1 50S ribosomal protein L20 [Phaeobacter gallaeciensis]MDE4152785.1 50S ribosomal protein L20 [Phaeobacter gallaeciensis]MDE4191362.1 50S ribosomal protein L20 [Phaeobacter gallaeciensis]MDE4199825.1 50S ribosomal protein L20 [Phaeobacter gallaeciensis]